MKTTIHPLFVALLLFGGFFVAVGSAATIAVGVALLIGALVVQSRHKARQRAAYEAAYRAAKEKHDRAFIAAMKSLG